MFRIDIYLFLRVCEWEIKKKEEEGEDEREWEAKYGFMKKKERKRERDSEIETKVDSLQWDKHAGDPGGPGKREVHNGGDGGRYPRQPGVRRLFFIRWFLKRRDAST